MARPYTPFGDTYGLILEESSIPILSLIAVWIRNRWPDINDQCNAACDLTCIEHGRWYLYADHDDK